MLCICTWICSERRQWAGNDLAPIFAIPRYRKSRAAPYIVEFDVFLPIPRFKSGFVQNAKVGEMGVSFHNFSLQIFFSLGAKPLIFALINKNFLQLYLLQTLAIAHLHTSMGCRGRRFVSDLTIQAISSNHTIWSNNICQCWGKWNFLQ